MKKQTKIGLIFTLTVTGMWMMATTCFAHYLWVQQAEDGAYAVYRGTLGERLDSYNPSCVTQISAKSSDGTKISITRTNEKERAIFTADLPPAMVSVTSKWGDRVNTTQGKKLMDKKTAQAQGFTVVSAFASTQFSKTIFAPSKINTQALGLQFELLPLTDPATLAPGTPVSVKLLFDGQPLAGMSVLTNTDQESRTDENGVTQIVFEKAGIHLLYATHQIPAKKDSGLDFLKFMTFLTFEVK